jgi:hypothetical protein
MPENVPITGPKQLLPTPAEFRGTKLCIVTSLSNDLLISGNELNILRPLPNIFHF